MPIVLNSRPRWTRDPVLTIGCAVADDFYGLYMTLVSLCLHHPGIREYAEFVIVDNRPDSMHGEINQRWVEKRIPNGRLIQFPGAYGTSQPREEVFRQARGKWVLVCDSHVMFAPNALTKLIEYLKTQHDDRDMLVGPAVTENGVRCMGTHQRPIWGSNAIGLWSCDKRGYDFDAEPFEVWQQGMGCFVMSKSHWVHFHPDFRGFGGCETYVQEKVRRQGGRVMCCPFLRWQHRFPRLEGDNPNDKDIGQTVNNYCIGWSELGWDTQEVVNHFHLLEHERPNNYPLTTYPIDANLKIAVVGQGGPMKLRGEILQQWQSLDIYESADDLPPRKHDVVLAIRDLSPQLREKANLLILDPCDAFWSHSDYPRPADYWLSHDIQPDCWIATSPAAAATMREAFPRAPIDIIPHACSITPGYGYDPNGPITYCGQSNFIRSRKIHMAKACKALGRELRIGFDPVTTLPGSSIVLCIRTCPFTKKLFSQCKPQIKLENACALGIPVVTSEEAAISLRPYLSQYKTMGCSEEGEFVRLFARALNAPMVDTFTWDPNAYGTRVLGVLNYVHSNCRSDELWHLQNERSPIGGLF